MVNKNINNRQCNGVRRFNYAFAGYYFVTICTADRYSLFGEIIKGKLILNAYGQIAKKEWLKTEDLRDNVKLDEFVIMPNHVHGIICITYNRDTARRVPAKEKFGKPTKNSLPTIVRSYKSAVTKGVNELNEQPGDKIWQPKYHNRIIHNEKTLKKVRKYILENPNNWKRDSFNQ